MLAIATLLLMAAALATAWPVRRALLVDPGVVLRTE